MQGVRYVVPMLMASIIGISGPEAQAVHESRTLPAAQCPASLPQEPDPGPAGAISSDDTPHWARSGHVRPATDCRYGAQACSPCVRNALARLSRPDLDIREKSVSFAVRTGGGGIGRGHIQGVARLADIVRSDRRTARMILTHNIWDDGLVYAERTYTDDGRDALLRGPRHMGVTRRLAIRETFRHPGGAQAHGDTVAIAMERGPKSHPAAVFFMRFPGGGKPQLVQRLILDGSHGEPSFAGRQKGASAAAFLKLASGRFLVAVSGTHHGRQGIWFYKSAPAPEGISARTEWQFAGFWKPACTTKDEGLEACFGGASGMALIADCDGDILLITFHGTDMRILKPEYQWLQVYRLNQLGGDVRGSAPACPDDLSFKPSSGGRSGRCQSKSNWLGRRSSCPVTECHVCAAARLDPVKGICSGMSAELELVYWQRNGTGAGQLDNAAFRWAGGLSVTANGRPVVFNTERRTRNVGKNRDVDGNIYFSQPSRGTLNSPRHRSQ